MINSDLNLLHKLHIYVNGVLISRAPPSPLKINFLYFKNAPWYLLNKYIYNYMKINFKLLFPYIDFPFSLLHVLLLLYLSFYIFNFLNSIHLFLSTSYHHFPSQILNIHGSTIDAFLLLCHLHPFLIHSLFSIILAFLPSPFSIFHHTCIPSFSILYFHHTYIPSFSILHFSS